MAFFGRYGTCYQRAILGKPTSRLRSVRIERFVGRPHEAPTSAGPLPASLVLKVCPEKSDAHTGTGRPRHRYCPITETATGKFRGGKQVFVSQAW
jgi:hypothetical protein